MADRLVYESTYRRSTFAVIAILGLLVAGFGGGALAFVTVADTDLLLAIVAGLAGAVILGLGLVMLTGFRVHRWTLDDGRLTIEERPKVRFMGRSRRASASIDAVGGLTAIEDPFIRSIEARIGAETYRLSPTVHAARAGGPRLADTAGFEAFARALGARAGGHGAIAESLGFWNGPAGLALMAVLFVLSLGPAGMVIVALIDGAHMWGAEVKGAAFLLMLPVGAGWGLWAAWHRRRAVLDRRGRSP